MIYDEETIVAFGFLDVFFTMFIFRCSHPAHQPTTSRVLDGYLQSDVGYVVSTL